MKCAILVCLWSIQWYPDPRAQEVEWVVHSLWDLQFSPWLLLSWQNTEPWISPGGQGFCTRPFTFYMTMCQCLAEKYKANIYAGECESNKLRLSSILQCCCCWMKQFLFSIRHLNRWREWAVCCRTDELCTCSHCWKSKSLCTMQTGRVKHVTYCYSTLVQFTVKVHIQQSAKIFFWVSHVMLLCF